MSVIRPLPYSLIQSADQVPPSVASTAGGRAIKLAQGKDASFVLPALKELAPAVEVDAESMRLSMILPSPIDVPRIQLVIDHGPGRLVLNADKGLPALPALSSVNHTQFAAGLMHDLKDQMQTHALTRVGWSNARWDMFPIGRMTRFSGAFAWPVHWIDGEPHVLLRGFRSLDPLDNEAAAAAGGALPTQTGGFTAVAPIGAALDGRVDIFEPLAKALTRDLERWVHDLAALRRRPDPKVLRSTVTRARQLGLSRLSDLLTDDVLQAAGVTRTEIEDQLQQMHRRARARLTVRPQGASGLAFALREAVVAATPPGVWLKRGPLSKAMDAIPNYSDIVKSHFPCAVASGGKVSNASLVFGASALEQFFDFHKPTTAASQRVQLEQGILDLDRAPADCLGGAMHRVRALNAEQAMGDAWDGRSYDEIMAEVAKQAVELSGMHKTWEAVATAAGAPIVPASMRHLLPEDASATDVCATSLRGRLEIGAMSLHWMPVRSLVAAKAGERSLATDRLGQRVIVPQLTVGLVNTLEAQLSRMLPDDAPAQ